MQIYSKKWRKSLNVNLCNKYIRVIYKFVNFLNNCVFIYIRGQKMSYKFDSIVGKNEAAALKEMIFKRAQARAQTLNDDTQADVMDMARESFVSKDNPFSRIIENNNTNNDIVVKTETKPLSIEPEVVEEPAEPAEQIGFPQRELKLQQNRTINNQLTAMQINNNMAEAREALSNKKSFMGALNFLNSQAAVSLIRTRADKFEIMA